MNNTIHVAVGVVRQDNRILIAKRPEHVHQGGRWEFPGGKVESGESIEQALKRELREELSIECSKFSPLIQIPYQYPQKKVLLDVYWVDAFSGDAKGYEGQPIRWIRNEELGDFTFPEANQPIIRAIGLPRRYAITPAKVSDEFVAELENTLKSGINLLQLRLHEPVSNELMAQIIQIQKTYQCSLQINSYTWRNLISQYQQKLVLEYEKEFGHQLEIGLHLTSADLLEGFESPFRGMVSASCHTQDDILLANEKKLDFIVLSPVLNTSSHPDAIGMGWEKFQRIVEAAQLPVFALGGMESTHLSEAFMNGAQGIAAISSLWWRQINE